MTFINTPPLQQLKGDIIQDNKGDDRLSLGRNDDQTIALLGKSKLIAVHDLDHKPKQTLLNRFLNYFGYGWGVLKVKLRGPEGGEKFIQVNLKSFNKHLPLLDERIQILCKHNFINGKDLYKPYTSEPTSPPDSSSDPEEVDTETPPPYSFTATVEPNEDDASVPNLFQTTLNVDEELPPTIDDEIASSEDLFSEEPPFEPTPPKPIIGEPKPIPKFGIRPIEPMSDELKAKKLAIAEAKANKQAAINFKDEENKAKVTAAKNARDVEAFLSDPDFTVGNLEDICSFLTGKDEAKPFALKIDGKEYFAWLNNPKSFSIQAKDKKAANETLEIISINWDKKQVKVNGENVAFIPPEQKAWVQALSKFTKAGFKKDVLKNLAPHFKTLLNISDVLPWPIDDSILYLLMQEVTEEPIYLDNNPEKVIKCDMQQGAIHIHINPNEVVSVSLDPNPKFVSGNIVRWQSEVGQEQDIFWSEFHEEQLPAVKESLLHLAKLSRARIERGVEDVLSTLKTQNALDTAQLILLRASLESGFKPQMEFDGAKSFKALVQSFSAKVRLIIQESQDSIKFEITPQGEIEIIKYGFQKNYKGIPERFVKPLMGFYRQAVENSASYQVDQPGHWGGEARVIITTPLSGVKMHPEFHLRQLTDGFQTSHTPYASTTVNLKNADLTLSQGSDAGGLSRSYFNELFGGMVTQSSLRFAKSGDGLYLPETRAHYEDATNPQTLPTNLEKEEADLYKRMGNVMMHCYMSQKLPDLNRNSRLTGQYLHQSVFTAIQKLWENEIRAADNQVPTNVDDWSDNTKLMVIKALAEAQDLFTEQNELAYNALKKPHMTLENAKELAKKLHEELGQELDSFTDAEGEFDESLVTVGELKQELWKILYQGFGMQLAPVRAIAFGMLTSKTINHSQWEQEIRAKDPAEFNKSIQGALDSKRIANAVIYNGFSPKLQEKTAWLKKWLADDNTKTELIRDFLELVTGAPSLGENAEIAISESFEGAFFYAHACYNQLDIRSSFADAGMEDTEDSFIEALVNEIKTAKKAREKGRSGFSRT